MKNVKEQEHKLRQWQIVDTMMIIRKEQIEAFRSLYFEKFALEINKKLKSSIPQYVGTLNDEEMLHQTISVIEDCSRFGITSKNNIYKIAYIRYVFPETFIPKISKATHYELAYPDRSEDDRTSSFFIKSISQNFKK